MEELKTASELHRLICYNELGSYNGKESTYVAMERYATQEIEKHLAKVLALDPYTCEIGGNVCLLIDKKDITNIKINLT